MYGLALETHGRDDGARTRRVAPTGDPFNSIELDEIPTRAPNPMVNAGAIAITDLVVGDDLRANESRPCARCTSDTSVGFRTSTERSGRVNAATGNHNRAIAYLMLSQGIITDRVEETLDLYFASVFRPGRAHSTSPPIAATIANHGVHPRDR